MAEVTDTQQFPEAELEGEGEAEIVDAPQEQPGADFLTGDAAGPFLDTGLHVGRGKARYGYRIYLSLKHLAPPLREVGWLTAEDAEELKERNAELEERNAQLEEAYDLYQELLDAIEPHFEVETVVETKTREVARKPTQHEIAHFLNQNPDFVAKKPEVGSREHYESVYKGLGFISGERPSSIPQPGPGDEATATTEDVQASTTQPVNQADPGVAPQDQPRTEDERSEFYPSGSPGSFELQGQIVNLDEVLDRNVQDIADYAEGHGDEFAYALAKREVSRAQARDDDPRKTLIEKLGYDYDDFLAGVYDAEEVADLEDPEESESEDEEAEEDDGDEASEEAVEVVDEDEE